MARGQLLTFKPATVPEKVPSTGYGDNAYQPVSPEDPGVQHPNRGEVWSGYFRTQLMQGASVEQVLAQTAVPSTGVAVYINANSDAALNGATVNIYASAQGIDVLVGTGTMPAVSNNVSQPFVAYGFACDFFIVKVVPVGATVKPATGAIVAFGVEAPGNVNGNSGSSATILTVASGTTGYVRLTDNLVEVNMASGDCAIVRPGGAGSPYPAPPVGWACRVKNVSTNDTNDCTITGGVDVEGPSTPGAAPSALTVHTAPAGLGPGWFFTYEYDGTAFYLVG
jgi:hypothetical protein